MTIDLKLQKLKKNLKAMKSVLIAYSGGVDSTLLLKIAGDVLKGKVLAVIAGSPTYPQDEIKGATKLAKKLGVKCRLIKTNEFSDTRFVKNPRNRCYYCKLELFSVLKKIAKQEKLNYVLDGSNLDDLKDFRPGSRAKSELKIRSPLQEVELTKKEIRFLSKKMKLPTWNKPSLACLASRIPYGTYLKKQDLERVNKAEQYLRSLGFKQVRVRHYGDTARIEIERDKIKTFIVQSTECIVKLKKIGYKYITLDMEGYRTGSMN